MLNRLAGYFYRNVRPLLMLRGNRKKIWLAYLIFVLIPVLAFQQIYLQRSSSLMKREVTHSILQAIRQVESNISYRLLNLKEMSDMLIMNPDLHLMVGRPQEEDPLSVQIDDQRQLYKMLIGVENRDEVRKVRLFVDGRKIYASDNNNFFDIQTIAQEGWFQETAKRNGKINWVDTTFQTYMDAPNGEHVLSAARVIKDPRNFSRIAGVLVLDMPEPMLAAVLKSVEVAGMETYITNEGGTIISHPEQSRIGQWTEEGLWKQIGRSDEGIAEYTSGQEYIIYKTIPSVGWKIVSRIPVEQIISGDYKQNTAAANLVVVITCLILFFFAVLAIFAMITQGTLKRIKQLGLMIEKEGMDILDGGIRSESGAIMDVENHVSRLIRTVKNLMEETYSAKEKEREAQLKALQAQINPHFLYNTLDTINWMAIRRDAEEISSTIGALAKYFRLSLNKGQDIVTVADELNLAKAYLEIQKNRFVDMFTYHIEVDDELLALPIPKLSLQPIIENALLHGIQNKADLKGTLGIEGYRTSYGYCIIVTDDGVGMEEEFVATLLLEAFTANSRHSYGLYNVNERIRLFAGHRSGITIRSLPGEGTTVELRVEMNVSEFREIAN
ncbi:MAG: histidine kinase [Paenibacillus sp.]|jgi:two-component system sensor histidine kinase YesM|nr:histidine kinase [Paenibacillus sp.]